MKYIDHLIWAGVVVVIGAVVIPMAAPAAATLALIGTGCFIAIRVAIYFTQHY